MSRTADRLRGVPPPRRPAGRRGRAARHCRLPDVLRAEARRRGPLRVEKARDRRDPDLALGRAGDDRHVGPEARRPRGDPRRVPPDRHDGAGRRSFCEHMPGLAKVMDRCTLVRSLGHTISAHGPGTIVHGHGQPAEAGAGVPRGGVPGGAAAAAAAGRPALRHLRRAERRCPGHRPRLPRPGVRPVRGRGRPARGARSSRAGCRSPTDSRRAT